MAGEGAVLQTLAHHSDIAAAVGGTISSGGTATRVITGAARVLLGVNLAENAAGTAKVRIHDGVATTSPILVTLTFAANGSALYFFPDEGIEVTSGSILIEAVSGAVEGQVYWG